MKAMKSTVVAAAVAVGLAAVGCSSGGGSAAATRTVTATVTVTAQAQAAPTSTSAAPTSAPTVGGNAATNPACKLLSFEQIATHSTLAVTGVSGLVAGDPSPDRHSEQCTWYLDPKYVQSSVVVQYTRYSKPPSDIATYYRSVIKQGYGKLVPNLGTIAKIDKHVVDVVYARYEIHLTLLVHAEATAADQAGAIELVRLVMKGLK
jgi:hypothetical protein